MQMNRPNTLVKFRVWSSVQDVLNLNFWRASLTECLGTFILIFIGLGSCYGTTGVTGIALAFGFGGCVSIYMTCSISGGHINPAVSLGLLVARQISLIKCMSYMFFQILGALLASKCIAILTSEKGSKQEALSTRSVSIEKALFCEVIITFILVFTVMRLCVEKSRSETERGLAALIIGICIVVCVLCSASISGGSMNPARSLGPAIVHNHFVEVWIYIAGPLLGGVLAGLLQQLLFTSELSRNYLADYLVNSKFQMEEEYQKYAERKKFEEFKKIEERKKFEEFKKFQESLMQEKYAEAKSDLVDSNRPEEKLKLTDTVELS